MKRDLIWIAKPNFEGFGCSECNWVFEPSDALSGKSLNELKQKYEAQRAKEFAEHNCAKPQEQRIQRRSRSRRMAHKIKWNQSHRVK
jgi:hypothetical protein